jgi:endonuclease/exonuclease/phosphatase family metal-dependent hydrolase
MKFLWILVLLVSSPSFAKWSLSTYNIRNFDRDFEAGPTNISELRKIILSIKSDVMAFEEVVNMPAFEKVIADSLPGFGVAKSDCGGRGEQHLALVFNKRNFDFVSQEEDLSFSGSDSGCGSLRPVLLVTLKEKSSRKNFVFGLVHLKAGGDSRAFRVRWEQYKKLAKLSEKLKNSQFIMLGDFNTTGYNIRNEDFHKFEDFLSAADLRTVAENISCTNYWPGDERPEYEPSILDHIVMGADLFKTVEKIRVGSHCQALNCQRVLPKDLGISYASVSDHCPVQVDFK